MVNGKLSFVFLSVSETYLTDMTIALSNLFFDFLIVAQGAVLFLSAFPAWISRSRFVLVTTLSATRTGASPKNLEANVNNVSKWTFPPNGNIGTRRNVAHQFHSMFFSKIKIVLNSFALSMRTSLTNVVLANEIVSLRNEMSIFANPVGFLINRGDRRPNPLYPKLSGHFGIIRRLFSLARMASPQLFIRCSPCMSSNTLPSGFILNILRDWANKFVSMFFSKFKIILLEIFPRFVFFPTLRTTTISVFGLNNSSVSRRPYMSRWAAPICFTRCRFWKWAKIFRSVDIRNELIFSFSYSFSAKWSTHNSKCLSKRRCLGATPKGICLTDCNIFAPRQKHYNRTYVFGQ